MIKRYHWVVIDAMNHAYRSWWRARTSTTSDGRDNSLESGFVRRLYELRQKHTGAQLVLAWDGEPVRQRAANAGYKAGRAGSHANRPGDWHHRCDRLRTVLSELYHTLFDPHDEADVEVARFVRDRDGGSTLIVTTDGDLLQLLAVNVEVYRPGLTPALYKLDDFVHEYGFPPERLSLYRAIVGDSSDTTPGLSRFPKRIARQLVAQFATVDALFDTLRAALPAVTTMTTLGQREKLLQGEAIVRSNESLFNLLTVPGVPHLGEPTRNFSPFRRLMDEFDLRELADYFEWDFLVGRSHA